MKRMDDWKRHSGYLPRRWGLGPGVRRSGIGKRSGSTEEAD